MIEFIPRPSRPMVGIGLVLASVFFLSLADVLIKYLAERHPVPVVIAVRFLVSLGMLAVIALPRLRSRLWGFNRIPLVLVRSASLVGGSLMFGLALQRLPVGEAVAITYLAPPMVMLVAIPLLGERVSALALGLAALGFIGVVMIGRPGSGLEPLGLLFAGSTVIFATIYHVTTRMTRDENSMAMLFNMTLVGAIVFSGMAVPFVGDRWPALSDLALMGLLGVVSTSGHFLFFLAYREAPATLIAPFNYVHVVWSVALGWVAFGHLPDVWTTAGMALVVASGVAIAAHAHFEQRRGTQYTVDPPIV